MKTRTTKPKPTNRRTKMQTQIDPKRLELVLGLPILSGSHADFEKGACVMEAVAYVAGEPHSDSPKCACPVLAAFLRRFNDRLPNDKVRTELLSGLVPKLVGSKSTPEVEEKRRWLLIDWSVRVFAARWMEVANRPEAAKKLRELPELSRANHSEVAQSVRAIRRAEFGSDYWDWRNARYEKIYAAVTAALKAKKWPADAAVAAAAAAAAADAADAADAAAAAADADAAAAAAAAAADAAAADAAAADAAADAADAADADAAAAADADADAARKFPQYGTPAYWDWRKEFRAEVRRLVYERYEKALGPAVARSRKDAVELVEKALAITK